jgi:hypothetical protein
MKYKEAIETVIINAHIMFEQEPRTDTSSANLST